MSFGRVFIILCGIFIQPSYAMVINHLYEAQLPLNDSNNEETYVRQGLHQVILKVTSNHSALSNPILQEALDNPKQFLQKYAVESGQMHVVFNPNEIDKLLKKADIAIWGHNRPVIMLWLAVAKNQGCNLISSESEVALTQTIQEIAKTYGIPVLLPLLDLEDVTALTVSDVWNNESDVMLNASKRYGSETFISAQIHQNENLEWSANWTLFIGEQQWNWMNHNVELPALILEGTQEGTTRIVDYYAVNEAELFNQTFLIEVVGIKNLKSYSSVKHYFENLEPVESVTINEISPSKLQLKVKPYGKSGLQAVQQAITLDPQLARLTYIDEYHSTDEVDLRVKWIH